MVFIYDSESGRGNGLGDAKLAADRGDKGGLTGSHLAVEGEDATVADGGDEIASGVGEVGRRGDKEGHGGGDNLQINN